VDTHHPQSSWPDSRTVQTRARRSCGRGDWSQRGRRHDHDALHRRDHSARGRERRPEAQALELEQPQSGQSPFLVDDLQGAADAAYVALRPSEGRPLLSIAPVQADPTQPALMVLRLDPRMDLGAETRSLLLYCDGSLRTESRCDIGLRASYFGNPAHPEKTVDRTVGPLPRRPGGHRRQPLPRTAHLHGGPDPDPTGSDQANILNKR